MNVALSFVVLALNMHNVALVYPQCLCLLGTCVLLYWLIGLFITAIFALRAQKLILMD